MTSSTPNINQLHCFPTVGFLEESGDCNAEVHGWFYRKDVTTNFGKAILAILRRKLDIHKALEESPLFLERAYGFAVQNQKGIETEIKIGNCFVGVSKTKRNGHFKLKFQLPRHLVESLYATTPHGTTVLPFQVKAPFQDKTMIAEGEIHCLTQQGISIISDIDDTIKQSNVGDKKALLKNTFLRPFQHVESMPKLFQTWANQGAAFHYVSATPWQLFTTVKAFLENQKFPQGSIHLRKFTLKDVTLFRKFSPSYKGKRKVIEQIMEACPSRQYYLYGDSSEQDPEMYGDVTRKYPKQVKKVFIRNVSGEASNAVRYQRAFANLPQSQWKIFDDASELLEFLP